MNKGEIIDEFIKKFIQDDEDGQMIYENNTHAVSEIINFWLSKLSQVQAETRAEIDSAFLSVAEPHFKSLEGKFDTWEIAKQDWNRIISPNPTNTDE